MKFGCRIDLRKATLDDSVIIPGSYGRVIFSLNDDDCIVLAFNEYFYAKFEALDDCYITRYKDYKGERFEIKVEKNDTVTVKKLDNMDNFMKDFKKIYKNNKRQQKEVKV